MQIDSLHAVVTLLDYVSAALRKLCNALLLNNIKVVLPHDIAENSSKCDLMLAVLYNFKKNRKSP